VRGCIQRRIGQLAVRDEQDIGAAVHHLMREAISMHSGMPLGCHQRPRCWPMAKWCNQKQSEAIRSNQRSNHLLRYWSLNQKQSECNHLLRYRSLNQKQSESNHLLRYRSLEHIEGTTKGTCHVSTAAETAHTRDRAGD
jgi:hypothetical protein